MNKQKTLIVAIIVVLSSFSYGYDWGTNPGDGSADNPYQISDPNQLIAMGSPNPPSILSKHFRLMNDLELSGNAFTQAVIAPGKDSPFVGSFDGSGHAILNLKIQGGSYLGLFGFIGAGGSVQHLGLENADVASPGHGYYIGGLCGWNEGGRITDCHATGEVGRGYHVGGLCGNNQGQIDKCYSSVSILASDNLGSLCGFNGGLITNCHATGPVAATAENAGGLCGKNSGTISRCYATGAAGGETNIGGLCGQNIGGTIRISYATGSVSGRSDAIGGLCGSNVLNSAILNSYATGTASGEGSAGIVGGLCGYQSTDSRILNCYSTGKVSGSSLTGGLVGAYGSPDSVESSYYLSTAGPDNGCGIPLTDAQMKQRNSFINWDFLGEDINGGHEIWRMCEDGVHYPILSWEYGSYGDFACPDGIGLDDCEAIANHWLLTENDPNFSYACDSNGDGVIDQGDFCVLSTYWHWLKPVLYLSNHAFSFFAAVNDFNPNPQILTIQNLGRKEAMNWRMTDIGSSSFSPPSWLSVQPTSGTLNPLESRLVTLSVNTAGLAKGKYVYTFEAADPQVEGSSQQVTVSLDVLFSGGNGTPDHPFLIDEPEQLIAIGSDSFLLNQCYRLIADIDLSGNIFTKAVIAPDLAGVYTDYPYEGIPFTGTFDGGGYSIRNLTISSFGQELNRYLGLFGAIGSEGSVCNLGIENANILGPSDFYGGLCGKNTGNIENCYATGQINGAGWNLGGLCGINDYGSIVNSYSSCQVNGHVYVGGLCGTNYYGTISDCYASGAALGDESIGGLCGYLFWGSVTNCYSNAEVGGTDQVGGLAGKGYHCPVVSSYSSKGPYNGIGDVLSDSQMKHQASFAGWDFVNTWWIDEGVTYPKLIWELPDSF